MKKVAQELITIAKSLVASEGKLIKVEYLRSQAIMLVWEAFLSEEYLDVDLIKPETTRLLAHADVAFRQFTNNLQNNAIEAKLDSEESHKHLVVRQNKLYFEVITFVRVPAKDPETINKIKNIVKGYSV